MTFQQLRGALQKIVQPLDVESDGFADWSDFRDVLDFLSRRPAGHTPAYASFSVSKPYLSEVYINSVLVDASRLEGDYVSDLRHWDLTPSSGWTYGLSNVDGSMTKTLFDPLSSNFSPVLANQTPIFFLRHFPGGQSYGELHQQIAHVLDIHCKEEEDGCSYYRLDENGDYVQVAAAKGEDRNRLCSVNWKDLESYLYLTDKVLIRLFDIIRYSPEVSGPMMCPTVVWTFRSTESMRRADSTETARGFGRRVPISGDSRLSLEPLPTTRCMHG
jgi:hypothetical protein